MPIGPAPMPMTTSAACALPQAPSPEPDYHEIDPSANDLAQPASASAEAVELRRSLYGLVTAPYKAVAEIPGSETIHRGMAQILEGQYHDEEIRMRHMEELIAANRAITEHRSLRERLGQSLQERLHL